jgi:hypothetical protein
MPIDIPQKITDFFPMSKIGGIPTLSGVSGVSGLGTSTSSRHSPPPLPPSDANGLKEITDHLKTISIGIDKISKNMNRRPQSSIVQLLESIDNTIDDTEIIILCKNPINRDDAVKKFDKLKVTSYESLSDAVKNISPSPDVSNIISNIN